MHVKLIQLTIELTIQFTINNLARQVLYKIISILQIGEQDTIT